MVADPKECRIYAFRCIDLARKATNKRVRAQFEDLAYQWQRIGADLEDMRRQIDEFQLRPDRIIRRRVSDSNDSEANA
jgi:hypothetical protein